MEGGINARVCSDGREAVSRSSGTREVVLDAGKDNRHPGQADSEGASKIFQPGRIRQGLFSPGQVREADSQRGPVAMETPASGLPGYLANDISYADYEGIQGGSLRHVKRRSQAYQETGLF